jgi:hypothetical protein
LISESADNGLVRSATQLRAPLVGAKVADTLEFSFLGIGVIIGAILEAAFFVIG